MSETVSELLIFLALHKYIARVRNIKYFLLRMSFAGRVGRKCFSVFSNCVSRQTAANVVTTTSHDRFLLTPSHQEKIILIITYGLE